MVVFEGYSTSVDKQNFLCLRLREKDWKGRDREVEDLYFLMANYDTPSKDELVIRLFSMQKVKELINEGKLQGKVTKRGRSSMIDFDKVVVTSSSDELIEVISKEGVGAFVGHDETDILVFSRIVKRT